MDLHVFAKRLVRAVIFMPLFILPDLAGSEGSVKQYSARKDWDRWRRPRDMIGSVL
jgi:hypothetical protein